MGQPGITDWQGPVLCQCPLLAVCRSTLLFILGTYGRNTVEWALRFFAWMLEYFVNESLMTGIPLPVYLYVHIPRMNPIYLHIEGSYLSQFFFFFFFGELTKSSKASSSGSWRLHLFASIKCVFIKPECFSISATEQRSCRYCETWIKVEGLTSLSI